MIVNQGSWCLQPGLLEKPGLKHEDLSKSKNENVYRYTYMKYENNSVLNPLSH